MVYTLRFFPLQNAVCLLILTNLVPVLSTFYIQGVLKLKKNNSGCKRLSKSLNLLLLECEGTAYLHKFGTRLLIEKMSRLVRHNPLTPNDTYRGRTALLTSKRCILYIYSTNIGTEYFKHGVYSPFFLFKMQFVS